MLLNIEMPLQIPCVNVPVTRGDPGRTAATMCGSKSVCCSSRCVEAFTWERVREGSRMAVPSTWDIEDIKIHPNNMHMAKNLMEGMKFC